MAENIKKITIGSESRNIEAAALGSEDKGNTTTPIYLEKGVPKPCNKYAGGTCVKLNGGDFDGRDIEICAPTEAGTGSDIIMWDDDTGQPVWVDPNEITIGQATSDASGNVITSTYATLQALNDLGADVQDVGATVEQHTQAINSLGANYDAMSSSIPTFYLTKTDAASIYLTTSGASSTYLTQTGAAGIYLTSTSASSTYLSKTDASNTYISKSSGINVKKVLYYADLVDVYIEDVSHAKITITAGASKDTQSGDVEVDLGYGEQIVLLSPQMIAPGATFELFFDKNTDICEVVCRDCYGECEKIIGINTGDCSLGFDYTCDESDVYAMVELEWF